MGREDNGRTPVAEIHVNRDRMTITCPYCSLTISGSDAAILGHRVGAHVSRHQQIAGHERIRFINEAERGAVMAEGMR